MIGNLYRVHFTTLIYLLTPPLNDRPMTIQMY